jgi:hypothetical protein
MSTPWELVSFGQVCLDSNQAVGNTARSTHPIFYLFTFSAADPELISSIAVALDWSDADEI